MRGQRETRVGGQRGRGWEQGDFVHGELSENQTNEKDREHRGTHFGARYLLRKVFHADPSIPHYGKAGSGMKIKRGMVFTIEPMINLGSYAVDHLDDGWTVCTRDRSLSAQFEHTLVVTKKGCEVLTQRRERLENSENLSWARCGPHSGLIS